MHDSYSRQRNSGLVEVCNQETWLLLPGYYHKIKYLYSPKRKSGQFVRDYFFEYLYKCSSFAVSLDSASKSYFLFSHAERVIRK